MVGGKARVAPQVENIRIVPFLFENGVEAGDPLGGFFSVHRAQVGEPHLGGVDEIPHPGVVGDQVAEVAQEEGGGHGVVVLQRGEQPTIQQQERVAPIGILSRRYPIEPAHEVGGVLVGGVSAAGEGGAAVGGDVARDEGGLGFGRKLSEQVRLQEGVRYAEMDHPGGHGLLHYPEDEGTGGGLFASDRCGGQQLFGSGIQPLSLGGVQGGDGVACFEGISRFGVEDDAGRGVDLVLLAVASRAQQEGGGAVALTVHRGDVPVLGSQHHAGAGGGGEAFGVVDPVGIAPLCLDHSRKGIQSRTVGHDTADVRLTGGLVASVGDHQHVGGQRHAQLGEVGGAVSLQGLNGLDDLQGVADGVAQRPVHVGDEGADSLACPLANIHHGLGQSAAVLLGLHEGTAARFHVQQDAIVIGGQLLAHDGGGDEGEGIHRGGYVAEGVEELVRRGEIGALPHDGDAYLIDNGFELGGGQISAEARNGLQFIHSATGMTQTAAAHLGHLDTQCGHDGGDGQTGLVAHAAGGVLVHAEAVDSLEVEGITGIPDGHGEGGGFLGGHAAEVDRHAEGGGLVVGDLTGHVALHERADLGVGQSLSVSFLFDDVVGAHVLSFLWGIRGKIKNLLNFEKLRL